MVDRFHMVCRCHGSQELPALSLTRMTRQRPIELEIIFIKAAVAFHQAHVSARMRSGIDCHNGLVRAVRTVRLPDSASMPVLVAVMWP